MLNFIHFDIFFVADDASSIIIIMVLVGRLFGQQHILARGFDDSERVFVEYKVSALPLEVRL